MLGRIRGHPAVSFVVDIVNLAEFMGAVQAFQEEIQRGCVEVVQDACLDGAEHARAVGAFKDQTGELRRSIKAFPARRTGNGAEGSFGTTLKRAIFVEDDTKAHTIRPRNAKMLRWEADGAVHFARVVQHPGTKGKPFIGPGAIKAEGVLYARAELLSARAIARFQRA